MKRRSKKKKRRPLSPEVRAEADRLYEHVVFNEELADKLVRRFAAGRPDGHFDYSAIATALAVGDPETRGGPENWPQRAMWERYAHHFQNRTTRQRYFSKIDLIAKRYLGDIIYCQADAARRDETASVPDLLWDETFLPRRLAPHLLRQWTIDCAQLRRFLVALFDHFARFHAKGSICRRSILVAQRALEVGWKPLEHTKNLIATGDIKLGQYEQPPDQKMALDRETATVGRSIRRMRADLKRREAEAKRQRDLARDADRAAQQAANLRKEQASE
jgi:hypothetical protein